jgi:tetratricopeptide (TPR) repeat protein
MSSPLSDAQREILPRWRSVRETITAGEIAPARTGNIILAADFLADKISAWQADQSLPFATELIGAALVLHRNEEAEDAAQFVLAHRNDATPAAITLAERLLDKAPRPAPVHIDREAMRATVREYKRVTRTYPRSAFGWAELARNYAMLGFLPQAINAMTVAVSLGPSSRYILRAAARLYVHSGDPERAHHVLAAAPATSGDPWLAAAEISTAGSAHLTPLFAKAGQRLLESQRFAPFDIGELASALGTLEAKASDLRRARRLLRLSLRKPNENVIAQARWAAKQDIIDVDPALFRSPGNFEARAWYSFYAGEWKDALKASKGWLRDQPFSASPAVHSSYIASTSLEDHVEALRLTEFGLQANPYHPSLLNNKAYSLANLGRLDEAERALAAIAKYSDRQKLGPMKPVLLATAGLVCYRRGDPDRGRELYTIAIETAERAANKRLAAKAASFLALEEIRTGGVFGPAVDRALELSKEFTDTEFEELRRRVTTRATEVPRPQKQT